MSEVLAETVFTFPPESGAVIVFTNGETIPAEAVALRQTGQRIRSDDAVKADPTWQYTDAAGHEHRFDGKDVTNAVRGTRHIPCDGSCGGVCDGEGYDVPEWRCALCGEVLVPRYVPDMIARGPGIAMTEGFEYEVQSGPTTVLPGAAWEHAVMGQASMIRGAAVEFTTLREDPTRINRVTDAVPATDRVRVRIPLPPLRLSGDMSYESGDNGIRFQMTGFGGHPEVVET